MKGPHSSRPWTALVVSLCHKVHSWGPNTISHHRGFIPHSSMVSWTPCRSQIRTVFTSSMYATTKPSTTFRYLSSSSSSSSSTGGVESSSNNIQVGDKIQVEVLSFGPLGASVGVVGIGHDDSDQLLPVDAEPYAMGLISQKEIAYFRQSRGNVDVVRGEVLPAYVQKIRYV